MMFKSSGSCHFVSRILFILLVSNVCSGLKSKKSLSTMRSCEMKYSQCGSAAIITYMDEISQNMQNYLTDFSSASNIVDSIFNLICRTFSEMLDCFRKVSEDVKCKEIDDGFDQLTTFLDNFDKLMDFTCVERKQDFKKIFSCYIEAMVETMISCNYDDVIKCVGQMLEWSDSCDDGGIELMHQFINKFKMIMPYFGETGNDDDDDDDDYFGKQVNFHPEL